MYCLFILIPYGMDMTEELTRRRHLIEMGYDFAVQPFLLEIIFKEVKRYLSYFIPFVNIAKIIENENINCEFKRQSAYVFTQKIEDVNVSIQQRVEILKMLYREAEILIFDEPTAVLTPQEIEFLLEIIKGLRDGGKTIILITHYMEEIIHADKVFVMDKGKIAMEGTPREIFSQVEKLKELRLDVPQVTLLAHELRKSGLDIPEGILSCEELAAALGLSKGKNKRERLNKNSAEKKEKCL